MVNILNIFSGIINLKLAQMWWWWWRWC